MEVARRVEADLDNVGAHPPENQVLSQGNQGPPQDKAPISPPPMMAGDIRLAFMTLSQVITTQAQSVATKDKAMATQANREG